MNVELIASNSPPSLRLFLVAQYCVFVYQKGLQRGTQRHSLAKTDNMGDEVFISFSC